jgi:exosortase B
LSAIPSGLTAERSSASSLTAWWPVLGGLAVLYVPMYIDIEQVIWRQEPGTAAPIILAIVAWLILRERKLISTPTLTRERSTALWGKVALASGLLCYVAGRSQMVLQLQAISQIPVLLGLSMLLVNRQGRRRLWFPILFLIFLVPVPGSVLDELLLPLKQWVSQSVVWLLYHAGLPVARNGVVITIGSYELLIADACSGLNSMLALSGIGLLYVYLAGKRELWLNVAMLLSVVPIAFGANLLRVMGLVLLTYYDGDRTGRAFHHNAGYIEILAAFGCFFLLDHLLTRVSARRSQPA